MHDSVCFVIKCATSSDKKKKKKKYGKTPAETLQEKFSSGVSVKI